MGRQAVAAGGAEGLNAHETDGPAVRLHQGKGQPFGVDILPIVLKHIAAAGIDRQAADLHLPVEVHDVSLIGLLGVVDTGRQFIDEGAGDFMVAEIPEVCARQAEADPLAGLIKGHQTDLRQDRKRDFGCVDVGAASQSMILWQGSPIFEGDFQISMHDGQYSGVNRAPKP